MGCSWLNPHSSEKARYWFGVSSIYVKTELVKNRESIIRSHSFVCHSGNAHAFLAAKSLQALGYAEHLKWSQAGSWGGRQLCEGLTAMQGVNTPMEVCPGCCGFRSRRLYLAQVTGEPEKLERKVWAMFLHTRFYLLQMERVSSSLRSPYFENFANHGGQNL